LAKKKGHIRSSRRNPIRVESQPDGVDDEEYQEDEDMEREYLERYARRKHISKGNRVKSAHKALQLKGFRRLHRFRTVDCRSKDL